MEKTPQKKKKLSLRHNTSRVEDLRIPLADAQARRSLLFKHLLKRARRRYGAYVTNALLRECPLLAEEEAVSITHSGFAKVRGYIAAHRALFLLAPLEHTLLKLSRMSMETFLEEIMEETIAALDGVEGIQTIKQNIDQAATILSSIEKSLTATERRLNQLMGG